MIPKIIHYCWLSNEPFPNNIKVCIDSWNKNLLDYEFVLWDFNRFPRGSSRWVDQAFERGKFAFAADYIRLYALYNEGGIYLDSDVEVLKSYNDLLYLPYFIGQEKTPSGIEAATMGFEKGSSFIKGILDWYENRDFVNEQGVEEILPLPFRIRKYIASKYDYHVISSKEEFIRSPQIINVFTPDFFSPQRYDTKEIELTKNTFSIHRFAGSWVQKKQEKTSIKTREGDRISVDLGTKKHCKLGKNIIVVTNGTIGGWLSRKIGTESLNIFNKATISNEDWKKICINHPSLTIDSLQFLDYFQSNNKDTNGNFHPVATLKGMGAELHFEYDYAREKILDVWREDLERLKKHQVVFIFQNRIINKKDKIRVLCLLILCKKTIIL